MVEKWEKSCVVMHKIDFGRTYLHNYTQYNFFFACTDISVIFRKSQPKQCYRRLCPKKYLSFSQGGAVFSPPPPCEIGLTFNKPYSLKIGSVCDLYVLLVI